MRAARVLGAVVVGAVVFLGGRAALLRAATLPTPCADACGARTRPAACELPSSVARLRPGR